SSSSATASAPSELITLSLHDALPIWADQLRRQGAEHPGRLGLHPEPQWPADGRAAQGGRADGAGVPGAGLERTLLRRPGCPWTRSEEHTSELQSRENLVCRLLLE